MSRPSRSRRITGNGSAAPGADDFFAGVDEVRAYLDRNLQDPERRRERLARLARDLVKPRTAAELLVWLCAQVREALGAGGAAILRRGAAWEVWQAAGRCDAMPSTTDLDRWVPAAARASGREPVQAREGLVVALVGVDALLGAMWIEHGQDLDPASRMLLQAIVDTAGVALEQALAIGELARDPETGLMHEAAFVSVADAARREWSRVGLHGGALAFRSMADALVPHGRAASVQRLQELAQVVRQAMPPGAILGRRFDDVYAVLAEADAKLLEQALAARARAVSASFGACAVVYEVLPATGSAREDLGRLELGLSEGVGIRRLGG